MSAKAYGWPMAAKLVGEDAKKAISDAINPRQKERDARISAGVLRKAKTEEAPAPEEADDTFTLGVSFGRWSAPIEPPEYLVANIIPKGKVGGLVADSYSLKTWCAFSLAHAVACGAPWLGRHAVKQGRAVLVDFEMGESEIRRRINLLKDKPEVPGLGSVSYPDADLTDDRFWTALEDLVEREGVTFVVIDSLSAGQPSVDENAAEASTSIRRALRIAHTTGCTIVFIHHAAKSGGTARSKSRGHSSIYASLDFEFTFDDPPGGGKENGERVMLMRCTKMRGSTEPDSFNVKLTRSARLVLHEGPSTKPLAKGRPEEVEQRIKLTLGTHGRLTQEDCARRMGCDVKTMREAWNALRARGEIRKMGRSWGLDSEERRKTRVVAELQRAPANTYTTAKRLADAAYVDVDDVLRLERESFISSMGGSYFVHAR